MFTKRIKCGHCNQINDARFYQLNETRITKPVPDAGIARLNHPSSKTVHGTDMLEAAAYGFCSMCSYPTLLLVEVERNWFNTLLSKKEARGEFFGGTKLSIKLQYPEPAQILIDKSWPDRVAAFYQDAKAATEDDRFSTAIGAIAAGACMEQALKALGATGKNMVSMIDDLANKTVITNTLRDWAHQVRLLRNNAAHEGTASEAELIEMIAFIEIFLEVTFTIPHRIQARTVSTTT